MHSRLNPYLNFTGNAREAMHFYQSVFGGKLVMDTFGENNMAKNPADADKIMHAQLEVDNLIILMGSDSPEDMETQPGGSISLSLSGNNETELRGYYEKLSANGQVILPLEMAPWGDYFGMCTDKFGTSWMVNIAKQQEQA
jgi:PhnB protein